jgi:RHS repeat-associated protein
VGALDFIFDATSDGRPIKALGSTRAITNASGVTQATYQYDPYGNLIASTGSVANPFRYAGQYKDSESGLYYLRARYYDPGTAQFLTRDPMVTITMSPYGYVGSNPLNATDPTGDCGLWGSDTCLGDAAAAIAQAAAAAARAAAQAVASAAQAVANNLPNCTIFDGNCAPIIKSASFCVGGSIVGGIGVVGNVCIGETNGYQHGGLIFSGGPAVGLGAGLSGGPAISNAQCPQSYAGPFGELGGGFGPLSADVQVSPNGKTRVNYLGWGLSTPQGYVGANQTGVWQWW